MKMRERRASHDPLWSAIAGALDTPAAGPHPEIDDLIRYHGGELPGPDEERVRDHLVGCAECTETLLDLDRFVEAGADRRPVRAVPAPARADRRPMLALAASLLLAVVALAVWVGLERQTAHRLRGQVASLSEPRPDVPIVDLLPGSSARGEAGREPVTLAPGEEYVTLVLNLPGAVEVEAFEAEVVGPGGGVLWEGPLERSRFGTFTLGLWRRSLPPGESAIRLYGVAESEPEGRRLLETYALRVDPADPADPAGEER